jgi:hypothetical protein
MYHCEICNYELVEGIKNEDETLVYNEWLELNRDCRICHKKGCYECLQVCYTCCNESDLNNYYPICVFCNYNEIYNELDCGWIVCQNHKNDGCGECYANYNFQCKYS